jgi:hypothetical protein
MLGLRFLANQNIQIQFGQAIREPMHLAVFRRHRLGTVAFYVMMLRFLSKRR